MSNRLTATLTELSKKNMELKDTKQELQNMEARLRAKQEVEFELKKKVGELQALHTALPDRGEIERLIKTKEVESVKLQAVQKERDALAAELRKAKEQFRDNRPIDQNPSRKLAMEIVQAEFGEERRLIYSELDRCTKEKEKLLRVVAELRRILSRINNDSNLSSSRASR